MSWDFCHQRVFLKFLPYATSQDRPLQGAISAQKALQPFKGPRLRWDFEISILPNTRFLICRPGRSMIHFTKREQKKMSQLPDLVLCPGFQRGWLQSYKMRYGLIWFCNSNPTGANCLQLTHSLPVLDCYSQSLYLPTATPWIQSKVNQVQIRLLFFPFRLNQWKSRWNHGFYEIKKSKVSVLFIIYFMDPNASERILRIFWWQLYQMGYLVKLQSTTIWSGLNR